MSPIDDWRGIPVLYPRPHSHPQVSTIGLPHAPCSIFIMYHLTYMWALSEGTAVQEKRGLVQVHTPLSLRIPCGDCISS